MSTDADIIIALARKLEAENTRLRAENEALHAGQGRWPKEDLEDTPVKNVDTTPATRKENGENCTRHLTVHKLNTAPVGSAIYGRNLRKGPDERWWCGPYNYSAEDLIANGWADATIAYPEATP